MSSAIGEFAALSSAQRSAQADKSKNEIRDAWAAHKKSFEEAWPRRNRKLLFIVQEGNSGITNEDANDLLAEINMLDKRTAVDVILHTPGGLAFASERIAEALVKRRRTASFVPFYAMSAGTEIALATETVFFGAGANLGPYDLFFNGVSARDLVHMAKRLGERAPLGLQIEAQAAEKALTDEARKTCARISRAHKGIFGWRGCSLAEKLTRGDLYHGERILFRQAQRLGIKAQQGIPKSLYSFISERREQLRKLRELEEQLTLVQHQAASGARDLARIA